MKRARHEQRKSFSKWGLADQRTQTQSAEKLDFRRMKSMAAGRKGIGNIGKNNGTPRSIPAINHSTQFRLAKHSIISDPGGRIKVIPSHAYADHLAAKAVGR